MKKYLGFATVILSLFVFAKTANAESYTAYLSAAQEVPTNASTGTGKARIVIDAAGTSISYNITFTGLTSAQILGHIHGPAAVGANAGVQVTFPVVGGTSGTISGTIAISSTQVAQIRAGLGYINIHTTNNSGGEIRGQLNKNRPVDYDGDGRTDFSVLRFPSVAPPGIAPITYWNLQSTDGSVAHDWGNANTDFPVPGDYDGDGKDDLALYRDGANPGDDSLYLIFYSATNTFQFVRWGISGDQAIARDYDGDGITDMAVFRRGVLTTDPAFWYIRQSASSFAQRTVQWGTTGDFVGNTSYDVPVPGDYDGDGKFDIAVYRFAIAPANTFIILRSSDGTSQFTQWGDFSTDYIAPGDFDGDGKTDFVAVRTGASGASPMVWQILRSSDSVPTYRTFGISSDRVVQGDYDGDGKTDIAIWRPSTRVFYVFNSFNNTATGTPWGAAGDFPTATFDAR